MKIQEGRGKFLWSTRLDVAFITSTDENFEKNIRANNAKNNFFFKMFLVLTLLARNTFNVVLNFNLMKATSSCRTPNFSKLLSFPNIHQSRGAENHQRPRRRFRNGSCAGKQRLQLVFRQGVTPNAGIVHIAIAVTMSVIGNFKEKEMISIRR